MNCMNRLCCYYADENCILRETGIDELVMCDFQIIVQREEELLAHLEDLEREWDDREKHI